MTPPTPAPFRYEVSPDCTEELITRFTYHAPRQDQVERYAAIRNQALELAGLLAGTVPAGPEFELAITHLETAVMFANAGIARRESGTSFSRSELNPETGTF